MSVQLGTHDDNLRHRKASLVELQDSHGRRRTVELDELSEADRGESTVAVLTKPSAPSSSSRADTHSPRC